MTFSIVWVDGQTHDEIAFGQRMLPDGVRLLADSDGAHVAHSRWPNIAQHADVLVARTAPVGVRELEAAPNLRLIQKYGSREDGIDLAAAAAAGVPVATMPLRGCIAVAECALTLILAMSKRLISAHAATVDGAYRGLGLQPKITTQHEHAFQWMRIEGLFEIAGTSLGIVGFGEIGTEIARRARAFDMNVSYVKRTRLPVALEQRLGVSYRPLDELLETSDVVVLAAPHTKATHHMIGESQLALMRRHAILINVARGGLIDEPALARALEDRSIAGAGLDVYESEPIPFDNPLLRLDNVILTPHIGGGTGGAREKQLGDVLANAVRVSQGVRPLHLIQGV